MADANVGCGQYEDEEVEMRVRLVANLQRVLRLAADEQARSLALCDIAAAFREKRLWIQTCAWCQSISLGGSWHRPSTGDLVRDLSRHGAATHGICPECFAGFVPDVPYPREDDRARDPHLRVVP